MENDQPPSKVVPLDLSPWTNDFGSGQVYQEGHRIPVNQSDSFYRLIQESEQYLFDEIINAENRCIQRLQRHEYAAGLVSIVSFPLVLFMGILIGLFIL